MAFSGTLAGSRGGLVEIQLRARGGAWHRAATVRSDAAGTFTASWPAAQAGAFLARAVPASAALAAGSGSIPTAHATVFRRAVATWYDLSGRTGACGVRLRRGTIGVAHRTLPCGSRVSVTYGGRTLSVPVVDRGPFVRGVSYDLTLAAAEQLGFAGTGRGEVGVLPQSERRPKSPLADVPPLDLAGGLGAR